MICYINFSVVHRRKLTFCPSSHKKLCIYRHGAYGRGDACFMFAHFYYGEQLVWYLYQVNIYILQMIVSDPLHALNSKLANVTWAYVLRLFIWWCRLTNLPKSIVVLANWAHCFPASLLYVCNIHIRLMHPYCFFHIHRISCNKRRFTNEHRPLTIVALFQTKVKISATPQNESLIRSLTSI